MTFTRAMLASLFAVVSLLHSEPAAAQGDYSRWIRVALPYTLDPQTNFSVPTRVGPYTELP